jgi:hypothetical protein
VARLEWAAVSLFALSLSLVDDKKGAKVCAFRAVILLSSVVGDKNREKEVRGMGT